MLTRRENLLIRPWQERRYIQHRQKVKAALPAIDNSPPPLRIHVSYKLKKVQKESERCTQIISDNFMLLQHLSGIMSTTRVDHFWEEPPTNNIVGDTEFCYRAMSDYKPAFVTNIVDNIVRELDPNKTDGRIVGNKKVDDIVANNVVPPEMPRKANQLLPGLEKGTRENIPEVDFAALHFFYATNPDFINGEGFLGFLQRVGIYTSKTSSLKIDDSTADEQESTVSTPKSRKDKCYACSPHRHKPKVLVDVRRPYTPPKKRITRKPEPQVDWETQFKSRCDEDRLEFRGKVWKKPLDGRSEMRKKRQRAKSESEKLEEENQSVVLTRGGLSVAVKFPPRTGVIFNSSTQSKVIQKHFCECRSFPKFQNKNSVGKNARKLK